MRPNPKMFLRISRGLCAALLLAAVVPAAADHYPDVRRGVMRKDQVVLDALRRLVHTETYTIEIQPFSCDCLEPTCDADFMLGCGGEMSSYTGFMYASRRTSRETCLVCGCAVTDVPAEVTATLVCAGF